MINKSIVPRQDSAPQAIFSGENSLRPQGWQEPDLLPFPNDTQGNAQRLLASCGDDLRYSPYYKRWLVRDDEYNWHIDHFSDIVTLLAKLTLQEFFRQALAKRDPAAMKFERRSRSKRATSAMIGAARRMATSTISGPWYSSDRFVTYHGPTRIPSTVFLTDEVSQCE